MGNKRKNPYRALIALIILAVVNVILFWLCVYVDTRLIPVPNAPGHPVPLFTAFFIIFMPVIDIIVAVICIVLTIVRVRKANQPKTRI